MSTHLYDILSGGQVSRPGIGGEGEEAREFVQRLLANAESIRFELDAHRERRDLYNRNLAYVIAKTAHGEININEELIRAGYSTYLTDFGRSTRYHDRFQAAQREAQMMRRGMWGGQDPDKARFREPEQVDPSLVLGEFARDAIDVVDADTLHLGLMGAVRFMNVQAAEVSSHRGRQDKNRNSHDLHLWRLSEFTSRRKKSWEGIRQSYPTSPGQFEAMKRHSAYDFPGGRVQDWRTKHETYFLDLETQGLWTRSKVRDPATGQYLIAGRSIQEKIHISEIAYNRAGEEFTYRQGIKGRGRNLSIHTWMTGTFADKLLDEYDITIDDLDDIEAGKQLSKVDAFLKRISDPSTAKALGVPKWSPATADHDTTPSRVARRVLLETLRAKKGDTAALESFKTVADSLMKSWKDADHTVHLAAWNVGYDFPVLMRAMYDAGHKDVMDLVAMGKVQPVELASGLYEMRFNRMLEDPAYNMAMTDRSKLEAALQGVTRRADAKKVASQGRLGLVKENTSLREFMDDLRGAKAGESTFRARRDAWLKRRGFEGEELQIAKRESRKWVRKLSGATNYRRTMDVIAEIQSKAGLKLPGAIGQDLSVLDMMNDWYADDAATHVNVFGDPQQVMYLSRGKKVPMAGIHNPFQFGIGGRLEDVTEILAEKGHELGLTTERVSIFSRFMAAQKESSLTKARAHQAFYDSGIARAAAEEIERIASHQGYSEAFRKIEDDYAPRQQTRRLQEHVEELLAARSGFRRAVDAAPEIGRNAWDAMEGAFKDVPGGWKTVLAAGVLAWGIGKYNRDVPDEEPIEAMRRPTSQHDLIEAIDPSNLPFSNTSAFGSGRDVDKDPAPLERKPSTHRSKEAASIGMSVAAAEQGSGKYSLDRMIRAVNLEEGVGTRQGKPTRPEAPSHILHKGVDLEFPAGVPTATKGQAPITGGPGPQMAEPREPGDFSWKGMCSGAGEKRYTKRSFRMNHSAPVVHQSRPESTNMSKVRDQATQLHRLPGLPRTYKGRRKPVVGHAEHEAVQSTERVV